MRLQNEKLMYLTEAALDYLKIINVPERALANEEISQKTPKRQGTPSRRTGKLETCPG